MRKTATNLLNAGAIDQKALQAERRVLSLTPRGLSLLSTCRGHAGRVERRRLDGFSREQTAIVRRWPVHAASNLAED